MFKIPELKRRILFTAVILRRRTGSAGISPSPGIDREALQAVLRRASRARSSVCTTCSRAATSSNATIFALGIMPYICASIILQLLQAVVPYFEKLAKEGEEGRKKINQ